MVAEHYWADSYIEKKRPLGDAVKMIKSGQRVFVGSSSGEPQYLVSGLADAADQLTDIEIVRLLSLESIPLTLIANKSKDESLNIRSFYLGSVRSEELARNKRFLTPTNLSYIPRLFKSRMFPLNVALIQTSPPDDFGWMSLGVSVDIALAAALSADIVIAQENPRMPWILGSGFVHVNDVDVIVEHEEELKTISRQPDKETGNMIARHVARLVDDGSTIQISLGATPSQTLLALSDKNDLGVHSLFVTDGMMHLVSKGIITNRKKGFNEGKMVASTAIGSKELYEFLNFNPSVDFHPADYVCDPRVISRHHRMVTMNIAIAVDLTGQVAVDAFALNHYTGVTGINDFIRGAALAEGGKSILMLSSTHAGNEKSCIVPSLNDTAVVVPRGDVHYVVTEYGAVNLLGKSFQDRAMALISISHPAFREELFYNAKQMGLISSDRTIKKALHGIYPFKLEETMEIDGSVIMVRPAKPVDERRIQEHFYEMEENDVIARFFHARSKFVRDEVENISQIDYIKEFSFVAVLGEMGFEKVIGIGEYALDEVSNIAEIAFSIGSGWQGKGLGKILIRKLSDVARENGISGLKAYMLPENQGMLGLFNTLPYKVKTAVGDDMELSCKFDELKTIR
jgi:acyl-CoA hydrolase/GNAT superfamily N-acetyltransferase